MKNCPLISAMMVSRNYGKFIGEAIESVLAQTYARWELIVVDNGSTDDSWKIIQGSAGRESRVRPVHLEREVSLPKARNLGLALAAGDYIATIDGDDRWFPARLALQVEFMEREEQRGVGVCGANCVLLGEDGRPLGWKDFPLSERQCFAALWYRNPFCHSATLIRRSVFGACGGYDERFELAEDLELWFRAGQTFGLRNLPDYLVNYRIWGNSASFRNHRALVRSTVRARRLAVHKYGYRMTARAQFILAATWVAQWLPSRIAHPLFRLATSAWKTSETPKLRKLTSCGVPMISAPNAVSKGRTS